MEAIESSRLNQEQREIVELFCGELAEIMVGDTGPLRTTDQSRHDLLQEFATISEQLGKALELAGLVGLTQCCKHLANNFSRLAIDVNAFSEELINAIASWPVILLNFLQPLVDDEGVSNEEDRTVAADELIAFLDDSVWPFVLRKDDAAALKPALALTDVVVNEERSTSLPSSITEEICSLTPGDEVRPELMEGLLIELPEQSSVFEVSIGDFLKSKAIETLAPAQRVAHTIKGSANIVGISGLANLMHFTEDLLEIIGKPGVSPESLSGLPIDNLLMDTADCLGDITDYLTGLAPKPANLTNVLQNLSACVNQFKNGAAAKDTLATADPETTNVGSRDGNDLSVPAPAVSAEASGNTEEKAATVSQKLSLSQAHAQQLLRIAGESQIANTQVMAQLDVMKSSIDQTERYHRRIKSMAMDLESLLQTQNAVRSAVYRSRTDVDDGSAAAVEFDPLELESYSELHSFSNQLLELTADSYEAVAHIEHQIEDLATLAYTQKQLNRDNNDLLLQTHMVSVDTIVPRLQRCVRQACRLTEKEAELKIIGNHLLVDNRVLNRIVDPLMHLLRNAVDHGIETPSERMDANKMAQGNITVEFIQVGEIISILCRDDGRGLDYENIQEKALEKGLITDGNVVDHGALGRLLFFPGFSTREVVSQTSGRGIGLDVVQEEVKNLKGSVHLSIAEEGGCCFTLSLPASILTAHALLVKLKDKQGVNVLSILSRGIENVVHIEPSQLRASTDGYSFQYNEENIPVFALHDLTAIQSPEDSKIGALLIVAREDQSHIAISIDAIIASQDLVIKPLNAFTCHPPGVIGATILGDGTVSTVIDIGELPGLRMSREEFALLQRQREAFAVQQRSQQWQLPLALIIDDSLSARQSLTQFVGELGMEVRTAKDGFEAISVMNDARPNVILVDLEMPRMNGLEFTAHLRADEATKDIPVIMITSRSTEKHREMAKIAGVDDYLNKPWSDEDLLTSIQRQMEKNQKLPLTANG